MYGTFMKLGVIVLALGFSSTGFCNLGAILKHAAKVGDNIPIQMTDDVARTLVRSAKARRIVDDELAGFAKTNLRSSKLTRNQLVKQWLMQAISHQPKLIKHIDALDNAGLETALVITKGGQQLARNVPDVVQRAKLLQKGGVDTVAAIGIHGDDAARTVIRLDAALDAGQLVVPRGVPAPVLADFGKVMTRMGDAGWTFWQAYIVPHWKIWAGGGALAAYLANPELFQDALGGLTEAGARELTKLVGTVATSTITGAAQGVGTVIESQVDATIALATQSVYSALGLLAVFLGLLLLFKPSRRLLLTPLRRFTKTAK